jgi:hypothetical protein
MNTNAQTDASASASADRLRRWLWTTLAVQVGTLILYPAAICGCHFHSEAVVIGAAPLVWAGFTFLAYNSWRERLICYLNAALAIGWMLLEWDSNIQFAFR